MSSFGLLVSNIGSSFIFVYHTLFGTFYIIFDKNALAFSGKCCNLVKKSLHAEDTNLSVRMTLPHHEAIDNLTPSDRYFGRDIKILGQRQRTKDETTNLRRKLYRAF